MRNKEGKVHFTMDIYAQLFKEALFAADSRSQFLNYVYAFIVLCWNMFQRANTVGSLSYTHFSWEGDSMVVTMSKHKGDQTGDRTSPKHLFANPYDPFMCPVLALALHVFCCNSDTESSIRRRHHLASR